MFPSLLVTIAFFLVAFGQPAWVPINGLIAAAIGYALFFRALLEFPETKKRFWMGFGWFFAIQLVQMSWFLSHPYLYIIGVYLFIATWLGAQFGLISLFITNALFRKTGILSAIGNFLAIASLWTILEWSRLFLLSGLSWNPAGLAYTSSLYALQIASLWGIFGLSFWVIFVNLLALYSWIQFKTRPVVIALWLCCAALPYIYGAIHLNIHENRQSAARETTPDFTTVLVQTALPTEESIQFESHQSYVQYVIEEWRTILDITKKHHGKNIDLIALPEFVVPFGTYSFVYPLNQVAAAFTDIFKTSDLSFLPTPGYPFSVWQKTTDGLILLVNNAYWIQAIANLFDADIVAGLEDADRIEPGKLEYYSSAQFTHPQNSAPAESLFSQRYAKRVLVPMGEYIPFTFCKKLAEGYGVFGSFTPGKEATIMTCNGVPFSPSICYEETYGHLMSHGRKNGAELLVNLTSDVWYPNSKLPQQHLDHARLRTVENGVPLIRACNTGVTGGIDSLGKTIALLGGDHPEEHEWTADSLLVSVPMYTYNTVYSRFGDTLIIGISFAILLIWTATRLRD